MSQSKTIILLDERFFIKTNDDEWEKLIDKNTVIAMVPFPQTDYEMIKIIKYES